MHRKSIKKCILLVVKVNKYIRDCAIKIKDLRIIFNKNNDNNFDCHFYLKQI